MSHVQYTTDNAGNLCYETDVTGLLPGITTCTSPVATTYGEYRIRLHFVLPKDAPEKRAYPTTILPRGLDMVQDTESTWAPKTSSGRSVVVFYERTCSLELRKTQHWTQASRPRRTTACTSTIWTIAVVDFEILQQHVQLSVFSSASGSFTNSVRHTYRFLRFFTYPSNKNVHSKTLP